MYLDYFPYESLRPQQDRMLDAVYDVVSRGKQGILMIDAPTGTGKTSCISAALAAAPGKIVVAVRTVSQIDIYIDEINRIWSKTRHKPEIAYMVGKQRICPLEGEFRGRASMPAAPGFESGARTMSPLGLQRAMPASTIPSPITCPRRSQDTERSVRTTCEAERLLRSMGLCISAAPPALWMWWRASNEG